MGTDYINLSSSLEYLKIFIVRCFKKIKKIFFPVPTVWFVPKQSTFLVRYEPIVCVNGHHSHSATQSPWVWELPAWKYDTRVQRPLWGLHPPNEQTPDALSSQDYPVAVPRVSFEDTSPSLIRELSVDTRRERLLFPASLYGFGNTPWEVM